MASKDLCEIGTAGTPRSQTHGGLGPVSEWFTQELWPPWDQPGITWPQGSPVQHPWHHTRDSRAGSAWGHQVTHFGTQIAGCAQGSSWPGAWGQMVARIRGLIRNLHDLILLQM